MDKQAAKQGDVLVLSARDDSWATIIYKTILHSSGETWQSARFFNEEEFARLLVKGLSGYKNVRSDVLARARRNGGYCP